MVLMIDNYDSFTWNLVQYLRVLGGEVVVVRNDGIDTVGIASLAPECIVISPGPGNPAQAGISLACVRAFAGRIPILGICLGMQAIAEAFGAGIRRALEPVHGKVRSIRHDGRGMFEGLPDPLMVTRYHSLIVDPDTMPRDLEVSALSDEGEIMGLRHRTLAVEGVQFHPEAVLTECGTEMLGNFLRRIVKR